MIDEAPLGERSGAVDRPRILLLGASGQLGWELARAFAPFADVTAPGRASVDLANPKDIRRAVERTSPACIVNAAAYTAVDRAETDRELAFQINAIAPGVLAEEARRVGALLVHYSTDYVFDGEAGEPYTEASATAPLSVYGESKLAGERAILDVGGSSLVIRTGWLYGHRRVNFLRTIQRLALERKRIEVVDDQVGAPTWCGTVAAATARLLAGLQRGPAFSLPSGAGGLFHLSAAGRTSWYGFAEAILKRDPARGAHRCLELAPVGSDEYPTTAIRPKFSVLDNTRVKGRYGISLPHWRAQLDRVLT